MLLRRGPVNPLRLCAVMLLLSVLPRVALATSSRLLFFDPDANQERLVSIKELFNAYLEARHASVVFEPVASNDDFDRYSRGADAKFAIVTSAYLKKAARSTLSPLLVPESAGSVYYQKQLVDQGKGEFRKLNGKVVAAVVADDQAAALLTHLRDEGIQVEGAFVISVSKDIDALLALAFGQADAALVTSSSIEVLRQLNPTAAARLRSLYTTSNILRAPFCELHKRASNEERNDMLALIEGLPSQVNGQQLMQVLSVQKWVPFSSEMLK